MNQLANFKLSETDGVAIMSSIEMVAYINATRKEFDPELRHDNFMAKVPRVLGVLTSPKFSGVDTVIVGNGATKPRAIYNFPKREACLMAMSYSYELQAIFLMHGKLLKMHCLR